MITISAIATVLSKYGVPILEFLKKNWKQVIIIGLIVWVVICCMTHCRSGKGNGISTIDTVSVTLDTSWNIPDTSAIFALYGFDTLPDYVHKLENRVKFKPKPTVIHNADNTSDSLIAYIQLLEEANRVLLKCDSAYDDAVAIRTYDETLENDSIRINVSIRTKGELFGEPKFNYKYLAPYPTILKTVLIKETVTIGPFRKIYLQGGIGPRLLWKENQFNTIAASVGLGYTDKKNWSYGAEGIFTPEDYTVMFKFSKSFNFGN